MRHQHHQCDLRRKQMDCRGGAHPLTAKRARRGRPPRSGVDLRRSTSAPRDVSAAAGSLSGNHCVTCAAEAFGGALHAHTSEAGDQWRGQSGAGGVAPSNFDVKASRGSHWQCASRAGTSIASAMTLGTVAAPASSLLNGSVQVRPRAVGPAGAKVQGDVAPEHFAASSSWWTAAFPECYSMEASARRIAAPTGGGPPRLGHLPERHI